MIKNKKIFVITILTFLISSAVYADEHQYRHTWSITQNGTSVASGIITGAHSASTTTRVRLSGVRQAGIAPTLSLFPRIIRRVFFRLFDTSITQRHSDINIAFNTSEGVELPLLFRIFRGAANTETTYANRFIRLHRSREGTGYSAFEEDSPARPPRHRRLSYGGNYYSPFVVQGSSPSPRVVPEDILVIGVLPVLYGNPSQLRPELIAFQLWLNSHFEQVRQRILPRGSYPDDDVLQNAAQWQSENPYQIIRTVIIPGFIERPVECRIQITLYDINPNSHDPYSTRCQRALRRECGHGGTVEISPVSPDQEYGNFRIVQILSTPYRTRNVASQQDRFERVLPQSIWYESGQFPPVVFHSTYVQLGDFELNISFDDAYWRRFMVRLTLPPPGDPEYWLNDAELNVGRVSGLPPGGFLSQ